MRATFPWMTSLNRGLAFVLMAAAMLAGCRSSKPAFSEPALPAGWLPGQAQVAAVEGRDLRIKSLGGSWHRPRVGEWLATGAVLEAPAPACLTLRLYEMGVLVHVKPGARLRLSKLSYRRTDAGLITSTLIELSQGEVAVDNGGLPAGSDFAIQTPQGTTQIPSSRSK